MIQLTGIVRNGKIEVLAPRNLADGTEVELLMVDSGLRDTEVMDDSELAQTLAAMDRFASEFPANDDCEDLSRAARENAAWEKSQFEATAKKLEDLF